MTRGDKIIKAEQILNEPMVKGQITLETLV